MANQKYPPPCPLRKLREHTRLLSRICFFLLQLPQVLHNKTHMKLLKKNQLPRKDSVSSMSVKEAKNVSDSLEETNFQVLSS